MVPPAVFVAATKAASDSNFFATKKNGPPAAAVATTTLRVQFYFSLPQRRMARLQNGLAAKVILDFRTKLGNRCKLFPVYALQRASILDFRPRLENRCSAISATVRNGFAFYGRSGNDVRVRFYFLCAKKNGPPAACRG